MTKMIDTFINDKWHILLPEHRSLRPEWPWWEKERLASMRDTTKPGDVVYYIGSEEGDMCGLLAQWGAKLVMFEPNGKVWPNTKAIWEANNFKAPLAIWDGFASDETKNGDGLTVAWPESANGPVVGDHGFVELWVEDPKIPQIKIDDLTKRVRYPDMISLDVEGAEGRVLRGAEETLKKYHPRIYLSLHYDFLHDLYHETHWDLRDWLKELGYEEIMLGEQPHEQHVLYSFRRPQ